jgi:hypothetical protein
MNKTCAKRVEQELQRAFEISKKNLPLRKFIGRLCEPTNFFTDFPYYALFLVHAKNEMDYVNV